MRAHPLLLAALALIARGLYADETLYRYEGDILPYHPTAGWQVNDPCVSPCSESLEDGHFVLHWPIANDIANYHYWIAQPPDQPPSTLWVEWRFRSNHPHGGIFFSCDGRFSTHYGGIHQSVNMYGDAVFSASGDDAVFDLDIEDFHMYRFESLDGINYVVAVDGAPFIVRANDQPYGYHYLQFSGSGGCIGDEIPDMVNEWDFVRFGTISFGEHLVATEPPTGYVDARMYPSLDRLAVTFDAANYIYIDEIDVEIVGGSDGVPVPAVIQTRRRENDEPDTVEIVLDQPIPLGERTRFTIDDGVAVNVIEYEYARGDTDGDGDADLADFAALANCFGATAPDLPAPCPVLDADGSGTIDLTDYASWRLVLHGPVP